MARDSRRPRTRGPRTARRAEPVPAICGEYGQSPSSGSARKSPSRSSGVSSAASASSLIRGGRSRRATSAPRREAEPLAGAVCPSRRVGVGTAGGTDQREDCEQEHPRGRRATRAVETTVRSLGFIGPPSSRRPDRAGPTRPGSSRAGPVRIGDFPRHAHERSRVNPDAPAPLRVKQSEQVLTSQHLRRHPAPQVVVAALGLALTALAADAVRQHLGDRSPVRLVDDR